jgi:predicted ester cyclase
LAAPPHGISEFALFPDVGDDAISGGDGLCQTGDGAEGGAAAVIYSEESMKLIWVLVVILAAVLGMAGGYKLALAREHQRLEKNKELVRLAFQWMSGENKEARDKMAHQIYADNFTVHDWLGDRTIGADGMANEASATHRDFSGWTEHPEIMVADGDYVAVRSWAGGKQARDFDAVPHNSPPIPNKGRALSMQESTVARIVDGKVAEVWQLNDGWDVNMQLGLFDPDHWRESVCGAETKR